jgi:hypothetical protein
MTIWKPVRPWTPNQQVQADRGVMATRLSTKRACDGPHNPPVLIGDTTEIEMAAVTRIRRQSLSSVQHECGLDRGFHVVFANPDQRLYDWRERDGDTWTITVLCPGIPAGQTVLPCATYEPCGCPEPGNDPLTSEYQAFVERPCPASPSGSHRYVEELGTVAALTGPCWYQHDAAPDAVAEFIKAPGMYPVDVSVSDVGTPVYELVSLKSRNAVPAPVA